MMAYLEENVNLNVLPAKDGIYELALHAFCRVPNNYRSDCAKAML